MASGREINAADSEGYTALLLSLFAQDHETTRTLVKHGADINKVNAINNVAPLTMAVLKADVEMVKFLVDNKADTDIALPGGKKLYLWAKDNGLSEISKIIGDNKPI